MRAAARETDERPTPGSSGAGAPDTLDALVTRIATQFMDASAPTAVDAFVYALQAIAEQFGVDTSFLRSNDHDRGLSTLVAEWPPRPFIPDPDPLGEVPFDADPVFDATRLLDAPFVIRPVGSPDAYQERVNAGSGVQEVSMAMVPLLHGGATTGVLGFVTFGDRPWSTRELNVLQAVASLIVQLQGRVEAEERLQFQAFHDPLSGLPNRRAFVEELDRRLAEDQPVTLMFLDLDHFKSTNGFLGHNAGDHLLKVVGARLQALVDEGEMVARLAGDEFVLLQGELDDPGARGRMILDHVRRPVALAGHQITRTASLGIATLSPSARSSEELLRNADVAMRNAKAAGGDRVVIFGDVLRRVEDERAAIELGLREALDREELRLHFQPEVELATGRLTAVEALVRWQHPERGLIAASEFIAVAEETGIIVDLDRWVLERAVGQLGAWRAAHPGLTVQMRVNLSPAQLSTRNLVERVDGVLQAHGVPGAALCFEITEHAVMQDEHQATATLRALKALGVTLAIDDFGTGYSSMTQLKNLPLDVLKIDQSFVRGLDADPGDRAIVDAAVRLGRSFGLDIVAEGIETPALLRQLVELGCDRGQGYLIMRPGPPEALEALLAAGGVDLDALAERPPG